MPDHFLVVVVGFMTLKFLVVGVSQWARVDLLQVTLSIHFRDSNVYFRQGKLYFGSKFLIF